MLEISVPPPSVLLLLALLDLREPDLESEFILECVMASKNSSLVQPYTMALRNPCRGVVSD